MGSIKDLMDKKIPTGAEFQAKIGFGNFSSKLNAATRLGALKNLRKHRDPITKIASKRQSKIRAGKYTRAELMADYRNAIKGGGFTKDDKQDLKALLEHLSKGVASKAPPTEKAIRASKRKATVSGKVKPNPRRDRPDKELFDFSTKRAPADKKTVSRFSVARNPLSRQPRNTNTNTNRAGSGGGIGAAQGRGSLAGGPPPSPPSFSGGFRKPKLRI